MVNYFVMNGGRSCFFVSVSFVFVEIVIWMCWLCFLFDVWVVRRIIKYLMKVFVLVIFNVCLFLVSE